MKKLSLILLFFSLQAFSDVKTNCSQEELISKSCKLNVGAYRIHLLAQKITIYKDKKVKLMDTPIQSSLSRWESVRQLQKNGMTLLEFEAWDMPGAGGQSLIRLTYQIEASELKLISRNILQKKEVNEK